MTGCRVLDASCTCLTQPTTCLSMCLSGLGFFLHEKKLWRRSSESIQLYEGKWQRYVPVCVSIACLIHCIYHLACMSTLLSPWYDPRGWLGVKSQLSIYLSPLYIHLVFVPCMFTLNVHLEYIYPLYYVHLIYQPSISTLRRIISILYVHLVCPYCMSPCMSILRISIFHFYIVCQPCMSVAG